MDPPDARPDPDELLRRVQAEEQRSARAKLKIFFGFAPGVGKTYRMLQNARELIEQQVDVVVGAVETHGRYETATLALGLEILPRKKLEYRGHEGARRSVALYLELFPDLRFEVDEQVTEGDRVASRWTLNGTHRGRSVTLRGIVISRFEDGRIIEDWAASDTMEIPRQLGVWRSLLLLVQHRTLLRDRG